MKEITKVGQGEHGCLARCGSGLQWLSKAWRSLGLNLRGDGGVFVEVEMKRELQDHHERLSEDPQKK